MPAPRALHYQGGLTALEIMVTLVVISILSGLSVKPLNALLQKIKLQNVADGSKHFILNARLRAVSNPSEHCGVAFRLHGSAAVDDTILAFFDKAPGDKLYMAGTDRLYANPFVIRRRDKVQASIPSGFPSVLVFRGDGSATASAKVVLTLKNFQDTLDILASTGRVKVVTK